MVIYLSGDQVNKKGGMTGGYYDFRRSKLKYMKVIKQNGVYIETKSEELNDIGNKLKDILRKLSFIGYLNLTFILLYFFSIFMATVVPLFSSYYKLLTILNKRVASSLIRVLILDRMVSFVGCMLLFHCFKHYMYIRVSMCICFPLTSHTD